MKLYQPVVDPSITSLKLHSFEPSPHSYPPVEGIWEGSCTGWTAHFVVTTHTQKLNQFLHRMSYLTPLSGLQAI